MDRNDFEKLLDMTLMDGVLTEQEQRVLIQRASEVGITPDELQIMIDAKMQEKQINQQKEKATLNQNQILMSSISSAINSSKKSKRPTKCPSCGAPLSTYQSTCPQCGAEIVEDEGPSGISMTKFSEMLSTTNNIDEKKTIIQYAAIPATKSGLFDFITFANAQFKSLTSQKLSLGDKNKLRGAWYSKCIEISNKASIVFKNDSSAKHEVDRLIGEVIQMNQKFKSNTTLFYAIKYGLIGLGILLFFIGGSSGSGVMFFGFILLMVGCFVVKPSIFSKFMNL